MLRPSNSLSPTSKMAVSVTGYVCPSSRAVHTTFAVKYVEHEARGAAVRVAAVLGLIFRPLLACRRTP